MSLLFTSDSYLRPVDFDIDGQLEEEDKLTRRTDKKCAKCGGWLCVEDELTLVQIVQAYYTKEGIHAVPLQKDDGDYQYDPRYLHLACWSSLYEDLKLQRDDEPPVVDKTQLFLLCAMCGSNIRPWEPFGYTQYGDLTFSKRSPSGVSADAVFEEWDEGTTSRFCLSCLLYMSDDDPDLWVEVSHDAECQDCTHVRCWREEQCDCRCHRVNQ